RRAPELPEIHPRHTALSQLGAQCGDLGIEPCDLGQGAVAALEPRGVFVPRSLETALALDQDSRSGGSDGGEVAANEGREACREVRPGVLPARALDQE